MKITNIRTLRLLGPRHHDVGGGESKIAKLIVRIDTDSGLYGLGEADDFLGVHEGITYLRDYFMGRDPVQVNAIVSETLYGTLPPHPAASRRGMMPGGRIAINMCSPTATVWGPAVWAVSGVAMALCDLVGKAWKVPAYALFGGKFRDAARVYLDRSSPDAPADLDAWETLARETVDLGFSQMKFDIDFMAPECTGDVWNRTLSLAQINRMVERIARVRETVGADFELCVDCHMQYNVPDAVRLAKALTPFNLLWLEDPTPIINPDSCRQVRELGGAPVCIGEMFVIEQFRLFVDSEACDILHPDILFCGGPHEMKRIADYAELHHLPVAFHGNGGAMAAIAAAHVGVACRNFLGLEYHFIESSWIGDFVRRDVPLFRDGRVEVTDAPGFGVELDRAVCTRYLAPGEALFD